MQIKLLETLVEELAGSNSGKIVGILFNKKDVNEFLIAKKMNISINQVRNILYKLSAEGLVSFIRKKDKKKGWFIYYWTLNIEKCIIKLQQSIIKKTQTLHAQLKSREAKRFYICRGCNIEVSEETALEHDFTCNECAEVYELSDNEAPIREIKIKIARKERELKMIENELQKIREKNLRKKRKREEREKKKPVRKKAKKSVKKLKPKKKLKKKLKKTEKRTIKKALKKIKSRIKKISKKKTKSKK